MKTKDELQFIQHKENGIKYIPAPILAEYLGFNSTYYLAKEWRRWNARDGDNDCKLFSMEDFRNAVCDSVETKKVSRGATEYTYYINGDVFKIVAANRGLICYSERFVEFLLKKVNTNANINVKENDNKESEEIEMTRTEENNKVTNSIANSEIQVFKSEDFGEIRTVEINGEPWFVGKDVAEILGYSNASNAVYKHVDNEDKQIIMIDIADTQNGDMPIGQSRTAIINESGLYNLIFSSKLPTAKQFKRWVTAEVLPTIRKHGAYMTPDLIEQAILNPDIMIRMATEIKKEQEKSKRLLKQNEELHTTNKLLTDNVLMWTNRKTINAIVRKLAGKLELNFGAMWGILYKELSYKYGISLTLRASHDKDSKKKSLLDYVHDDEWEKFEASIAAICERNGIDTVSFFKSATNGRVKFQSP